MYYHIYSGSVRKPQTRIVSIDTNTKSIFVFVFVLRHCLVLKSQTRKQDNLAITADFVFLIKEIAKHIVFGRTLKPRVYILFQHGRGTVAAVSSGWTQRTARRGARTATTHISTPWRVHQGKPRDVSLQCFQCLPTFEPHFSKHTRLIIITRVFTFVSNSYQ